MNHLFWTAGFFTIIIGVLSLCLALGQLSRKKLDNNEKISSYSKRFAFGVIGLLFSIFVALTLVKSQNRYWEVLPMVNKEAYLLDGLYRAAGAFPERTQVPIRESIKAYLSAIIGDEWHLMSEKKESPEANLKLNELSNVFEGLQPQTEQEKLWTAQTLQILQKVRNARFERIHSSWQPLGMPYWATLILGCLLMGTVPFFLKDGSITSRIGASSFIIGCGSFLLFAIHALDNPFNQPQPIKPTAYEVVCKDM